MSKLLPRIAAVDYGAKRVGLAMTDPLRMFAQPIGTFSPDDALARLVELHSVDGIETVVVGWPLMESGEEGKATRRVEPYFGRLKNTLPFEELKRQSRVNDVANRAPYATFGDSIRAELPAYP